MPTFNYKALDNAKQVIAGSVTVKNKQEAAQSLVKRGLSPLIIKEYSDSSRIKGTVPPIDKITFCRYLSTMLSSGLSLSEGIEVLRGETKHTLMRRILGDMSYSLEQGQQLSTVFDRYPNVFEPYFLTLTHAGEVSGKLAEVFKYLEAELRAEYSMFSKIKGALLYPLVVFTAMIAIGMLMFFFVLPQIGKVFLSLKLPLPFFTQFMFKFSLALSGQFIPIIVGIILSAIIFFFWLKQPFAKEIIIKLIQPLPLVRDLIKKIDLARFNRIFSTLLRSAVPITEALEISLSSLSWFQFKRLSHVLPEEIRTGKSLALIIKEKRVFPSLMIQMVTAGEKTGTLDSALADLASFYEEEVEEELKSLTQIIEPVLMLLVGISVGIMILSIIAPIYSVVGTFQQAAGTPGTPPIK